MPGELTQAQSLWFTDEVRKIRAEVLRQDVPELEAFTFFDVETDVPIGAQEFGSDMITQFGDVAVISNDSDDLRYAEVGIYRSVHKIIALGNAYKWTHLEALAAARSRKVPRRLRGVAARDIMLQNLNDIGINGKHEYGVEGFLTFPGVPRHSMATSFESGDDPTNILNDMLDIFMRPIIATYNASKPTHFVMPLDKYLHVATTARSTTSGSDTTILEFFVKQVRGITGRTPVIMGSWMFEVANKCAVWRRGDTASAKLVIPGNMRFSQLNPQVVNYEHRVPCLGVTGGWYTEYPLRAVIGEFS
jgi:hypothetical protein